MRILTSAKYALGVSAAVAVLAACNGGSGSQIAPGAPMTGNAVSGTQHAAGIKGHSYLVAAKSVAHQGQPKHVKQWMEPGASNNRLLLVSDFYANDIQVYNYPSNGTQNPPAGTITSGLLNPQGMCVDSNNNAYVANTGDHNVLEFASGATTPSNTYPSTGFAVGCSVDPTTGNVAISNIFEPSTYEGSVTICSSPSSCSTSIEPGGLFECYFAGYAPNGDLYVDGEGSFGFGLAYLPAGSSSWQAGSVTGATINFPGGVMYDGSYMTVTDQSGSSGNTTVYRCNASGATLDCSVGSANLGGSEDVVQPFVKRGAKGVVGADALEIQANTWAYPGGGNPRPGKQINIAGGEQPIGSAVLLPAN